MPSTVLLLLLLLLTGFPHLAPTCRATSPGSSTDQSTLKLTSISQKHSGGNSEEKREKPLVKPMVAHWLPQLWIHHRSKQINRKPAAQVHQSVLSRNWNGKNWHSSLVYLPTESLHLRKVSGSHRFLLKDRPQAQHPAPRCSASWSRDTGKAAGGTGQHHANHFSIFSRTLVSVLLTRRKQKGVTLLMDTLDTQDRTGSHDSRKIKIILPYLGNLSIYNYY